MRLARSLAPAIAALGLFLPAPAAGAPEVHGQADGQAPGQAEGVLLRSHAAAGRTLAVEADLILELGQAGSAGSLHLERRTSFRDRLEPSGAVVRSVDILMLRAQMPGVEARPRFVGRGELTGRTVRFTPATNADEPSSAPTWVTTFADDGSSGSDEEAQLVPLRVATGLADLVPGRHVRLGEAYPIEPSALAEVLALGGGYAYEDRPGDGVFPFRAGGACGAPLLARLESLRAVGDEHVAVIAITGSLSVELAFPGPGPLWRIGLTADERVPRRARLELEVKGRLEWWVEAGRADSLQLDSDHRIAEELTRLATICADMGLPLPEREVPFDPDVHLLSAREPDSAPQEGTLKLRLEVDC